MRVLRLPHPCAGPSTTTAALDLEPAHHAFVGYISSLRAVVGLGDRIVSFVSDHIAHMEVEGKVGRL